MYLPLIKADGFIETAFFSADRRQCANNERGSRHQLHTEVLVVAVMGKEEQEQEEVQEEEQEEEEEEEQDEGKEPTHNPQL
jgi:hypothetical protein